MWVTVEMTASRVELPTVCYQYPDTETGKPVSSVRPCRVSSLDYELTINNSCPLSLAPVANSLNLSILSAEKGWPTLANKGKILLGLQYRSSWK